MRRGVVRSGGCLGRHALALGGVVVLLPALLHAESRDAALRNRDATQAFEQSAFDQATDLYDEALTLEPESGIISYNLGNALYRQGQFEEASTALMRGALSDDPQVRQNSLFNLGNAFVQLQKYPEALTAYRKALELDPHDMDTKVNFEKAMQLLQQQQQQQKQQQKNDKQGDDKQDGDQNKDQQNQDQDQQQKNQDQQGDKQQDENQQNQDQQQQDQQDQQDQQGEQQQQEQDEQQQQEAQADSMRAVGEMTPEEALRILDAMREQEKELQKEKARKAQAQARGVEKDW